MQQILIAHYTTGAFFMGFVDSCTNYMDLKPERNLLLLDFCSK